MPLPSLPLDVLLVVLRGLDIIDVVRIGMVSDSRLPPISIFSHDPRNAVDLQRPLRGHTGPSCLD